MTRGGSTSHNVTNLEPPHQHRGGSGAASHVMSNIDYHSDGDVMHKKRRHKKRHYTRCVLVGNVTFSGVGLSKLRIKLHLVNIIITALWL